MTREEIEAREELGVVPSSQDLFGKRGAKFDELISERAACTEMKKQVEAELKILDDKLMKYLADCDQKTVMSGSRRITVVQSPGQSRLDKILLLEAGVSAETLTRCTVQGKAYSFLKVTETEK
jgi:hypothetical protein